ncbi:MAG: DUF1638 domain-containing protein (plasmid) [Candidatus Methanoperedens sp.]|uniref:DUF1638 domain-containing protein n=1 Tax=Candidatus Methanoperedens sp. BLZ2 TaxID=2035255 RepID=UPI000BE4323A|nr:DUF1638 domain-containing protein [Candidatus Methanoperedens sp. BLZ2]KAB2945246.1 MAG: DUF1638 domain-containing protein [Candidatus Methanoperedens sp.]MBZ0175613.1 DUF1638 domain-containing protein [Candidatus Methanoperedens nitroreducens]WAH95115.1 MAG: DUF1638 domain-containing protein [Candidatus Methanoperedens sp.]WAM22325.1 MAG: DUF1638 domain-containing protein [Candidatus Methanoperedens sp.]
MPVLSIIVCGMLEDELAYVLSSDRELVQLILVENGEHFGLQRKLKSLGCFPTLIPLDRVLEILIRENNQTLPTILKPLCRFNFIKKIVSKMENQHKPKVTVVANMLRRGLHADVEMVRVEVYRKIMEMSRFSDRILIFYGTCGHSLSNLEKDFENLGCQLYFLKDEKGEIVEDCISLALGGNDVYARSLVNGEGTFCLTPMWASNWEEKSKDNAILSPESDTKYLKLYGRAAKINTGLSYEPDFDKNVRDFARFFDLKIVELQGSKKIAEQSYQNAKRFPRKDGTNI